MKRKLWMMVLCLFLFPFAKVHADEGAQFTVPVDIQWGDGGLVESESYEISLKGMDEDDPLPAQTEYTLTASSSVPSFTMTYQVPGEYWYQIEVQRSDHKKTGEWYLHVTVINGENGGLQAECSLHEGSRTGDKTESVHPQDEKPEVMPSPSSESHAPVTGDQYAVVKYLILFLIALALLVTAGIVIHRKNRE